MIKGRFTLPGETGMEKEIKELAKLWGVDAIRDSDGTKLSQDLIDMGLTVYSVLCLVRDDNEWVKKNPDCLQQIYLLTEEHTAYGTELAIDIMSTFFDQQFKPNTDDDIKKYWQVMDRTAGEETKDWDWDGKNVIIHNAKPFHSYTVAFLAYQIWEPVSMYNHITNNWQTEHELTVDPRSEKAREHLLKRLDKWLLDHPKTDVVRFTTFFYCFDLIYNQYGKEKTVNWFGYAACVSPKALSDFEKEYGYSLCAEDIVAGGTYNTPFKNPTKKYLDWMEFNCKFVSEFARQCVEAVHKAGRKAIMFLGDHWAGTEPYGKYFQNIGLDMVVGAAGDGVTTRMITDIPVKETEARFYPYFFPDIFCEGGDPVGESMPVWIKCRRAMLRRPAARMGYGGYISLALKFPEFIDHVTEITRQFKSIHEEGKGTKPYTAPFKVAVLNSWGHIKSWQTHQVAHSLWNQRCYSYLGAVEALSGFPFDVEFISFEDVKAGKLKEYGVVLNMGDAMTSWSGGENWNDPELVCAIRQWVYEGGGFIGIGEPTAYNKDGRLFALSDVLGVQKEIGITASHNKPALTPNKEHFITEDICGAIDYGEGMSMIYSTGAELLDEENRSANLCVNEYGKGRAVYIAGLPYSNQNARLLLRAIYYSAHSEQELYKYYSSNPALECHAFEEAGKLCVVNNSETPQEGEISINGKKRTISLGSMGCEWLNI
ncbi:MAG: 1,3-beta-galactosyl-N-acetylhexosamine phosphorylase [Clostridiales bacterium]|nr:1,3-beta-galactosyl-N-acetylhexosamine phosphorylase [Clostridiales bacterium]